MARCSKKLEVQLMKSHWELQNIQRELQIVSGAVLASQHLALSKLWQASSRCEQLEGAEEQLDLFREEATSIKVASAETAVRSKEELASLQKQYDISRQRVAKAKRSVTVLQNVLEAVTAQRRNLRAENATLRMGLVISLNAQAETKVDPVRDLKERREELEK